MPFGTLKFDSIVGSNKNLTVDNVALMSDVVAENASWTVVNSAGDLAANTRYLVDSSSGAFTLNLPSSPTAGQFVQLADSEGTFTSNPVTIGRSGNNIFGQASDLVLNVNRAVVVLTYSGDSTTGWLVK